MKHSFKIQSNGIESKSIFISNVEIIKAEQFLIKDLPIQTTFQSQLHQQRINDSTLYNAKHFKEVTVTFDHNNKIPPTKNIVVIVAQNIHKSEQYNDVHSTPSSFSITNKTNFIHLDMTSSIENKINNKKNIL